MTIAESIALSVFVVALVAAYVRRASGVNLWGA